MKNETNQSVTSRLQQLIAEVDGPSKGIPSAQASKSINESTELLAKLFRWSFCGLLCLGIGFLAGRYNATLTNTLKPPSNSQSISPHHGWRTDGTGVFYRWCRDSCHAPRLYGGGVLQVFEVHCSDRPCGDLAMAFNVLNADGQIIDRILLKEKGMQGELRRFMIETQSPDAVSIELNEFNAHARV